ncbi:MAG: LamG-like jellyroll fold domain-containing protein [Candidatus Peregrinibacteria bacterium]
MKPSQLEYHPRVRQLEDRIMLSATPLAAVQQDTAYLADATLRAEPVELLSGTKTFNGSTVETIADSPVFTDGSFTIALDIRPAVQQFQTFVSKYDSHNQDTSFFLGMNADGRLQFSVYGEGGDYRLLYTDAAPLTIGVWQKLTASFDIQSQKMSITVDGKEVPSTINAISKEIRPMHDGVSQIRVGGSVFGGGTLTNQLKADVRDAMFYPVASFGGGQTQPLPSPEQAQATDAVLTEDEPTTSNQQITAEAIDAVLRAEPVILLEGTKTFNGSTVECIADSPVFTDGSFTIALDIRPTVQQFQTFVSKYNSHDNQDQSFFLGMNADGRLQFSVYGEGGDYRLLYTDAAPLTMGVWQNLTASFDIQSQKMSITVDGKEVPSTINAISKEIRPIHDGVSPVRVGASVFGSGAITNHLKSDVRGVTFYPVAKFGIPETTEQEPSSEPPAQQEQQIVAAAIDAVLRAEPVILLEGTKTFSGSAADVETIPDSPVFTDGSFTLEAQVQPSKVKFQTIISKYDTQHEEGSSFSLSMLASGQLDFFVGGNPPGKTGIGFQTDSAPLTIGEWQQVRASFDVTNQNISITVDGKEIPGTIRHIGGDVTAVFDSISPVRTGGRITGSGLNNLFEGKIGDARFYPDAQYGIPETTEQEPSSEPSPADSPPEESSTLGAEEEVPPTNPNTTETAAEQGQPLSLTERQLQQYHTRMAAANERFAAADAALKAAQQPQLTTLASAGTSGEQTTEAQALTEWQLARRETIAYAGITTIEPRVEQLQNGDKHINFVVHYRSPDTNSCMEVYRDGVRVKEVYLQHPAGEQDGWFWYNPRDDGWQGNLEFRYSSGNGSSLKWVARAEASYNYRESPQNAARVRTTFSDLESHDTGRLVDAPLSYDLKLMSTNGSNAVLHFTSPDDESLIASSTGGMYGQNAYSHPGGTSTGVTLITVNPTKIGRYCFWLKDSNGTIRNTIWVEWNGSTLSLVSPSNQWTGSAASATREASLAANTPNASAAERIATSLSEEAAETLEQERLELLLSRQMGLGGISVSSTNAELGKVQAKNFYERSGLFVHMEQMHEFFFTVHPDWRPENFQATVMRMWEEGGCNGPSGDTRDWLNGVILDMMGRYDRDLNVYAAAMAEIMQKGVEVCLAVRQGQPEGPLLFDLDQLIVGRGYWEAVGRLAGIGMKLPTRQQVIAEAKYIVDDKILEILRTQSENQRLIANFDLRQQNAQWMAARDDGLTNVTVLGLRKTTDDGYSPEEVDASEQRRRDRAARLVDAALASMTDSRAQRTVVISDEPNIQRKRVLANGTTQITITTAEAEQLATKVDEVIAENGGDATVVGERVLVAMNLMPDLDWATDLRTVEEIAAQDALETYVSSHAQKLRQELAGAFAAKGRTAQEAEQSFQWLVGHPKEVLAYQSLYAQADTLDGMFSSLCSKMASSVVSIRSVSLPRGLENPVQHEYLEHSIDLTTPGIRIIGHPVAYGVETPFWHSSILLVPEHPEQFANLGLKDEAGNPIFADGKGWATLGVAGETYFSFSHVGKVVSDYNRQYDNPTTMPNTFLAEISLPQGTSIDEIIQKIIETDDRYNDDANYNLFPELTPAMLATGYNCNSFTSGILTHVGVEPPRINRLREFPAYLTVPMLFPPEQ